MATSFIELNEHGFWSKDGFVEAMQICLINEIELIGQPPNWIVEWKQELALSSLPLVIGGMPMWLEEYLSEDKRKSTVIELIDSIQKKIDSQEGYLTASNFQNFRERAINIIIESKKIDVTHEDFESLLGQSTWIGSEPERAKDNYLIAFSLLKSLIKGELKTNVNSPIDYWKQEDN